MPNKNEGFYKLAQPEAAAHVFGDWPETVIWSCLQNIMGEIYADDLANPVSAMAILGDFCYFAGIPDEKLIRFRPAHCRQDFIIMVPQNDEWGALIEAVYEKNAKKVMRYALKKETGIFDREALETVVSGLPGEYCIRMIDEPLFMRCQKLPWCRDFVANYENYAVYQEHGLGVLILKEDEIIAGASSYSGYTEGIEVEIVTREDYRRKGLAHVSGARLILSCLDRGWYPSWDAQNKWSAALAQKLGYHYSHEYPAYEISFK